MGFPRQFREEAHKVPLDGEAIHDLLKSQSMKSLDFFHKQRDENDPLQQHVWKQMFHSHSNPKLKHSYEIFRKSREDKGMPVPYQRSDGVNEEPAGKRSKSQSKKEVDPRMCGKDAYDREALIPFEYARANLDGTCTSFVKRKRQILDASNRRSQRLAKRLESLDDRLKVYVEASRQGPMSNAGKTTKYHWHSEKNLRQMRNGLF